MLLLALHTHVQWLFSGQGWKVRVQGQCSIGFFLCTPIRYLITLQLHHNLLFECLVIVCVSFLLSGTISLPVFLLMTCSSSKDFVGWLCHCGLLCQSDRLGFAAYAKQTGGKPSFSCESQSNGHAAGGRSHTHTLIHSRLSHSSSLLCSVLF